MQYGSRSSIENSSRHLDHYERMSNKILYADMVKKASNQNVVKENISNEKEIENEKDTRNEIEEESSDTEMGIQVEISTEISINDTIASSSEIKDSANDEVTNQVEVDEKTSEIRSNITPSKSPYTMINNSSNEWIRNNSKFDWYQIVGRESLKSVINFCKPKKENIIRSKSNRLNKKNYQIFHQHLDEIKFFEKIWKNVESSECKDIFEISDDKKVRKDRLFPIKPGVDLDKLKLTNIAKYSICTPQYAEIISRIIASYFINHPTIVVTDATAAVGGNTISFAQYFFHVNSIEINKTHFDMLVHNLNVYGLKDKVTFYHNDFKNVVLKIKQDVIFFDPPWGGPLYIFKEYSDLDPEVMASFCKNLCRVSKLILFRAPLNFNFYRFYDLVKSSIGLFHTFCFYNFVLVVLSPVYL